MKKSALSTAVAATRRPAVFLVAIASAIVSASLALGIASTDAEAKTRDHRAKAPVPVPDNRWGHRPSQATPPSGGVSITNTPNSKR